MKQLINEFIREEDGQDLVEYALLLAFIALAGFASMSTIKTSMQTIWTNINTKMTTIKNAST